MNKLIYLILISFMLLGACSKNKDKPDAYGNFEVIETIISSETTGKITECFINEGEELKVGDTAFLIDNKTALLQKETLISQKNAISSGFSNIIAQVEVLGKQKEILNKEKDRIKRLLKDSAATQKQLDDITGQSEIIEKQIKQVETQNQRLFDELKVFDAQIKSVDEILRKAVVVNPINGTVLLKYSELYELVIPGKPLYKIADLSEIILRAYISETQLNEIKFGQNVKVFIDISENKQKQYTGIITWISDNSEFTPKVIQTKEERVNLVYAVKIKVKNDGSIKPGMPGEVKFK